MKKFLNLFIVSSVLFFASCDDSLLEPFTPGALTEDLAVRTPADLSRLANSMYVVLSDRSDVEFTSVFTDEVSIGTNNGGQGIGDNYAFILNPSSDSPNGIWTAASVLLARANKVIVNADRLLLSPALTAAQVTQVSILKAEALVCRAFAHTRMIGYFSPDPKNDNSLGGILALAEVPIDGKLPRSTNGAIYTAIHLDLNNAITLFGAAAFNPTRANRIAAIALKARAYALKGDYPNALTQANLVIASGSATLSTAAAYPAVFADATSGETIFKIARTINQSSQGSNLGNVYASVDATVNGSPFYEINRALFNAYPTGDVRRTVNLNPTSLVDPNYLTSSNYRASDVLCVGKHAGASARGLLNADFKLIRMSEMYLIKAEAEVASSQLLVAANTLKFLLDRRYSTPQVAPVFATNQDGWSYILNQRRIEFSFEGYRYIDLKRLGALAGASIDRHPLDCTPANSTLPITDYRFAMPIPTNEINPNPTIQQNPGY